jgi:16S rRNA (adenine(1408)-N(1))-methyltransferase
VGTGDGRFVLKTAAARPDALVVGLDANASAMAEASRRAARKPARGGPTNVLFVVAAAQSLPCELDGTFDEVTVHFPWGSLLRGIVRCEPAIVAGLARTLAAGGRLTVLLSITEREAGAGLEPLDEEQVARLKQAYAEHGLHLDEAGMATPAQIEASCSTWAKRLRRSGEVWRLVFRRCG